MPVRTHKKVAVFGEWCVTTYGIENTSRYYPIQWHRVWSSWWVPHIRAKNWGWGSCGDDFEKAITFARLHFQPKRDRARGKKKRMALAGED